MLPVGDNNDSHCWILKRIFEIHPHLSELESATWSWTQFLRAAEFIINPICGFRRGPSKLLVSIKVIHLLIAQHPYFINLGHISTLGPNIGPQALGILPFLLFFAIFGPLSGSNWFLLIFEVKVWFICHIFHFMVCCHISIIGAARGRGTTKRLSRVSRREFCNSKATSFYEM